MKGTRANDRSSRIDSPSVFTACFLRLVPDIFIFPYKNTCVRLNEILKKSVLGKSFSKSMSFTSRKVDFSNFAYSDSTDYYGDRAEGENS